ncbi:MAG: ubiquinone/menaquinone biosynthesis methyltransferase [Bacteroidales bacterium]|nr:ubiquinone/menaquinone biosynthesis methyltransferase [Bacteroidales bacterium]
MSDPQNNHPLNNYYSTIYKRYDLVNRIFTFGMDRRWRKRAVSECLETHPGKIVDLCTGTGDLVTEMARAAKYRPELTGYDFSEEMLQRAMTKAVRDDLPVHFVKGDVASMPFETGFFDTAAIAFGLRNLLYENSNAERHLGEIRRILRSGGRFVILESSKPSNRIWRLFNNIYLRFILPYLGGVISGNFQAYRYLSISSAHYYTRAEMQDILESSGFRVLKSHPLFLGSVMLMVAVKQVAE